MLKSATGVIRRVDKHTLHLARKLSLQRFQRQQVIAKNELIVEKIAIGHPAIGVIRLLWICQQNPWLQLGAVVFANPGEFKFLLLGHELDSLE